MEKTTLDNTRTVASEQDKPDYLVEREQLENTPFTLVKTENGYFVSLGLYRLTELGTKEEVLEKVYGGKIDWWFLMTTIATMQRANDIVK